jgi:AcrR family transcriptional regulator
MSSQPQQPGLRARKKQRTRQLIADTALQLFLERGFDAVTVAEIARYADVDTKTVFNHFSSKPDLFFYRLEEEFGAAMLEAIRGREAGESILAAFARFMLNRQGLLDDDGATERLRATTRTILDSRVLVAYEEQVVRRLTASLAAAIAEETGADTSDVLPRVVANALIGLHRSLIDYVRRETLAGTPNHQLLRTVRAQTRKTIARLDRGLGEYGVKRPQVEKRGRPAG